MAARENQGLQIALIIFVMLTIVLIVTTFVFFRRYQETDLANKQLSSENSKQQAAAGKAIEEANSLKLMIGVKPELKTDEVAAIVKKDMETYGNNFPESQRNYEHLVQYLSTELREKNTALVESQDREHSLMDRINSDQVARDAEFKKYGERIAAIDADVAKMRKDFDASRTTLTGKQEEQAKSFKARQVSFDEKLSKTSETLTKLDKDLKDEQVRNRDLGDKLRASEIAAELPDGKITHVNQRTRLAWINVGSEDALRRQTTFSVYDSGAQGLNEKQIKGKLEVVAVLGPHEAEARIVEDTVKNPILAGDQVASPVWQPGRAEHFALDGFMDIDGDGNSDRDVVKNLIALSGGVIDAEVGDDGEKVGKMTVNTKYLVMGQPPKLPLNIDKDKEIAKDFGKGYTAMINESQLLGTRNLSLADFLDRMGYKQSERTVALDEQATPTDFKPRYPGEVQRKSGLKSEIDKRRAPPRTQRPYKETPTKTPLRVLPQDA